MIHQNNEHRMRADRRARRREGGRLPRPIPNQDMARSNKTPYPDRTGELFHGAVDLIGLLYFMTPMRMGEGHSRVGVFYGDVDAPEEYQSVIKITKGETVEETYNGTEGNILENHLWFMHRHNGPLRDWLTPVQNISACGRFLKVRYTQDVPEDFEYEKYIPKVFGDTERRSNWGFLYVSEDNTYRLVCRDYAILRRVDGDNHDMDKIPPPLVVNAATGCIVDNETGEDIPSEIPIVINTSRYQPKDTPHGPAMWGAAPNVGDPKVLELEFKDGKIVATGEEALKKDKKKKKKKGKKKRKKDKGVEVVQFNRHPTPANAGNVRMKATPIEQARPYGD